MLRRKPPSRRKTRTAADAALIFSAFALLIIGLIFAYSSSAYCAEALKKDSLFYFKKQLIAVIIGLVCAFVTYKKYDVIREKINSYWAMGIISALLLWALFLEPIANVHRWIKIGGFQLQPSEFAKIAFIFFLAEYIDKNRSRIIKSPKYLFSPILITGIPLALIALSPDLGTPALLFAIVLFMLFAGGAKISHLSLFALPAAALAIFEISRYSYRVQRFLSFLSPDDAPGDIGYQLSQSLTAIGSGGWFGAGFGASKIKLLYLPAGHTDFVFSIAAEEGGMLLVIAILFLFTLFLLRGLKIAMDADHFRDALTAFGITMMIVLQAFFNMAMALGIIPTKGLPLPFFSYGGSSMITTLILTGILLNISSRQNPVQISSAVRRLFER